MNNNYMRSKMSLVIEHQGMSDARLKKLMLKIVKAAKGRSQREASLEAENLFVSTKDDK
jgi:hypothetical protein